MESNEALFDPYETAVFLENILALSNTFLEDTGYDIGVDKIRTNAELALENLHDAFPDFVPNGKKKEPVGDYE